MRITNVRAVQPVAANSPPDWRTTLGQILVAVDTDVGLTGYGVGGGGAAGIHVIRTVLRDLLLERDPAPVESLWDEMYRCTLPFGQKGLAIMAIGGVDLALWDLRGKAAGVPIAELLGGKVGEQIPTYTTVWGEPSPQQLAGHRAFKLHVEDCEPQVVADMVYRVREAVGDAELMIDAWMRWDLATTLKVAEMCADAQLGWIEEPLPVNDRAGYRELVERCAIPIAGGEHEFTAAAFQDLIEQRLHEVLQPDVCWCGGMTELVKIYEYANSSGVRVCPHRGAEVWGLHAIAALDATPLAESGRPWMTWVADQPQIVDGFIQLNEAPGFGVGIDEDNLPVPK